MAESTQIEAQEPDGFAPARPRLRADAAQNRARIVAAARQLFADRGIDAPMAAIARRAGVGAAACPPAADRRSPSTRCSRLRSLIANLSSTMPRPTRIRGMASADSSTSSADEVEDRGFTEAFITTITEELRGVDEGDRGSDLSEFLCGPRMPADCAANSAQRPAARISSPTAVLMQLASTPAIFKAANHLAAELGDEEGDDQEPLPAPQPDGAQGCI